MHVPIPWTPFERRWRDELLRATIPSAGGLPALDPATLGAFWTELDAAAPATLRLGFRVAVWALTWWPLLSLRPRRLGRLPPADADALLDGVARSPRYAVRQLAEVTRLVACMAYLRDPGVRARVE